MKQHKTIQIPDAEEAQLIQEIASGQWSPLPDNIKASELARHQQIASNTLTQIKKSKNINLRLAESDITDLRSRANEIGIPYQTLITLVLKQYLNKQFEVKI